MDIQLARESIDHRVVYDPLDGSPTEDGIIESVSERFVYVRYGDDPAPKATDPAALSLILVGESGAEYVLGDLVGLAPEPGTVCDAAEWGDHPSMARIGDEIVCRCTVCPRCHHHTGNAHQGHYWRRCKVTGTDRDFHLCCPDPAFGCEIEQRFAAEHGVSPNLARDIYMAGRKPGVLLDPADLARAAQLMAEDAEQRFDGQGRPVIDDD